MRRGALHEEIGIDEGKVTNENCHALAVPTCLTCERALAMLLDEHRVGRGLTTTRRRPIHHIVVKQRKSVEQFQSSARIDHARSARVTAAPDESPITKRRPQSFAAGKHEPANLPNRGD